MKLRNGDDRVHFLLEKHLLQLDDKDRTTMLPPLVENEIGLLLEVLDSPLRFRRPQVD